MCSELRTHDSKLIRVLVVDHSSFMRKSLTHLLESDNSIEKGKGTRFSLKLPFTTSLIQTLMIGIGDDIFAVPYKAVCPYNAEVQGFSGETNLGNERVALLLDIPALLEFEAVREERHTT